MELGAREAILTVTWLEGLAIRFDVEYRVETEHSCQEPTEPSDTVFLTFCFYLLLNTLGANSSDSAKNTGTELWHFPSYCLY